MSLYVFGANETITYRHIVMLKRTIKKYTMVLIAQVFKEYHHQRQNCGLLIISKRNPMLMLEVLHAVTSCKKIREDDCLILTLNIF